MSHKIQYSFFLFCDLYEYVNDGWFWIPQLQRDRVKEDISWKKNWKRSLWLIWS